MLRLATQGNDAGCGCLRPNSWRQYLERREGGVVIGARCRLHNKDLRTVFMNGLILTPYRLIMARFMKHYWRVTCDIAVVECPVTEVTMSETVRKYRVMHQDNPSAGWDLKTGPTASETEVRTYFLYSLPNTMRGSNPVGGARIFAPVQTGPGAHPASSTMGTESFPGVKSGWGVTLTPHPF